MNATKSSWYSMLGRCRNERHHAWSRYGGRGITVCERWLKYENFLADMGPRPDGTTLDRRDNDKGYEPDNCRWATRAEQNRPGGRGGKVGGARPGAGRPAGAGLPRKRRIEFRIAEHELAEIVAAVPEGELSDLCRTLLLEHVRR